jgi:hypothetical protein
MQRKIEKRKENVYDNQLTSDRSTEWVFVYTTMWMCGTLILSLSIRVCTGISHYDRAVELPFSYLFSKCKWPLYLVGYMISYSLVWNICLVQNNGIFSLLCNCSYLSCQTISKSPLLLMNASCLHATWSHWRTHRQAYTMPNDLSGLRVPLGRRNPSASLVIIDWKPHTITLW